MRELNSAAARSAKARLLVYFLVEFLCSIGQPLLTMGIFFYTHNKLGWGLRANLLLAIGEGAVYTVGAMLAHPIVERFGQRRALIGVNVLMAAAVTIATVTQRDVIIASVLLLYTFIIAINWPM